MVLEEIISLLSVNGIDVSPSPINGTGVGYTFSPITNDGIKAQWTLSIKVIDSDLLTCYKKKQEIDDLLITIGDTPLTTNILSCGQNGGGQYTDVDSGLFIVQGNYVVKERIRNDKNN